MKRLILLIILLFTVMYLIFEPITPYDKTVSIMTVLKRRIMKHVQVYNKLPENLNDMYKIPGHINSVLDGWDRPITYCYDIKSGIVTLISYGASGDPKCKYDKACIIRRFRIKKDSEGEWSCKTIEINQGERSIER